MAGVKFSPDLFLEVAELNRFKQALDDNGFRKNILDNSVSFGLIKNSNDLSFNNGRVQRDLDTSLSQRTIKINELFGVDSNANFLHLPATGQIPVPTDGNWYWVKVSHVISNLEVGTFSISGNGDLVDVSGNAELTKILRGMPNFPTRISFPNSLQNTLEYDVLEVIDNLHATIQHPASNSYGISEFVPETGLTMQIVGTFTQGISVPSGSKNIFQYDSATAEIVLETLLNTKPSYITGQDFFIARVKATLSNVIIQDKRSEYWETKGSGLAIDMDRNNNPLIGVESVQFDNQASPLAKNIVYVSWGMRSNNWSIDSTNNVATIASGNGGKYKSVTDFTDGDFNGWRLYTPTGAYHLITSSVKSGGAINCTLDYLEVDNFSNDGGATFVPGYILAVPNCEQVEILFTPDPSDLSSSITDSFVFPVNTLSGRCDVLVYKDPCLYNVQYRYKSIKEFTKYTPIPSDTAHGYYTEASFDSNGNLLSPAYYLYTSNATAGFIQLNMSPLSLSKFRAKVDKGDIIGVNSITDFTGLTAVTLVVGTDKNYQYINGTLTLANDIYFSLSRASAKEGNEFRFHFNASAINMAGHSIFIVQDFGMIDQLTVKQIKQGDIYQMLNQDNGIVIDCKYTGSQWVGYQNYDLGRPAEIITQDGVIADLYDSATGLGKVKGLFGWVICNASRTVNGINIPDLRKQFLVGNQQGTSGYNVGDNGGEETHTLISSEMPSHSHKLSTQAPGGGGGGGVTLETLSPTDYVAGQNDDGTTSAYILKGTTTPPTYGNSGSSGGGSAHNNTPLYYAVIYAKKAF